MKKTTKFDYMRIIFMTKTIISSQLAKNTLEKRFKTPIRIKGLTSPIYKVFLQISKGQKRQRIWTYNSTKKEIRTTIKYKKVLNFIDNKRNGN